MNKEAIIKHAEFLEALPREKFDMDTWADSCGTVACIGGWLVIQSGRGTAEEIEDGEVGVISTGAEVFDISRDKALELFVPFGQQPFSTSPAQAAKVLRHLAETGTVDWEKAFQ